MAQKKAKGKETVTEKIGVARTSVTKAAKKGRAVADESIRKSRRAIQSKPLTAVGAGIAAGAAAGVVAGVLLSRKKPGRSGTSVEEEEVTVKSEEMGTVGGEQNRSEAATTMEDDDEIIDDED